MHKCPGGDDFFGFCAGGLPEELDFGQAAVVPEFYFNGVEAFGEFDGGRRRFSLLGAFEFFEGKFVVDVNFGGFIDVEEERVAAGGGGAKLA